MTITNADIVSRLKLLADEHLKADSGTTSTLINRSIREGSDYVNYYLCFISGDNIGLDRIITNYTVELGTFEFDAVPNAVTSLDEFCLASRGYQSDIAQAILVIKNDFRNMGYDIDLFLNYQTQLKEMYIYKTIELICAGLMNDGQDQDVYFVNYNRFKDLYQFEKTALVADYDADEDGTIATDEEDAAVGQLGFTR